MVAAHPPDARCRGVQLRRLLSILLLFNASMRCCCIHDDGWHGQSVGTTVESARRRHVSQGEELEPARAKAEKMGIKEIYIEDVREEFVKDFVFPMFRWVVLHHTWALRHFTSHSPLHAACLTSQRPNAAPIATVCMYSPPLSLPPFLYLPRALVWALGCSTVSTASPCVRVSSSLARSSPSSTYIF